jgi:serine/threonine protein kinase
LYSCLSSAVHYIHRNRTKHMDIKPQNILIIKTLSFPYVKPLIADFGISRTYSSGAEVDTNGWTSFTKRYAAPEVVKQDFRSFKADIFSLGCVFLEISDALYRCKFNAHTSLLREVLDANPQHNTSYHANIDALQASLKYEVPEGHYWYETLLLPSVLSMLNLNPKDRPAARDLTSIFGKNSCCDSGAIQLEAMPERVPKYDD